jgi:hypothetical protein
VRHKHAKSENFSPPSAIRRPDKQTQFGPCIINGMPLRPVTIRFSEPVYDAVAREAAAAGETIAQFVREASLARAAAFYVRRGGPAVEEFFETKRTDRRWLPTRPLRSRAFQVA